MASSRRRREKVAYKLLRDHIPHLGWRKAARDPAISGNGLAALGLADTFFRHPAAGPRGEARLDIQDKDWTDAKLITVGIDELSLRNLVTHMEMLNRERPAANQKTNNDIARKLLGSITFPPELSLMARTEMQQPTKLWVSTYC